MSFMGRWTQVVQRRLSKDERGFTVVEVMASLIILSVGLVSLAYTANLGFEATAKARQDKAATLVGDAVLAKMASYDADIVRDGMYGGDSTLSSDLHIVSSVCESTTDEEMPCDGEALVFGGLMTSPLNPHRWDPADHPEQVVGPTSFTVYRYVTDAGTNLLRLTALVTWDDGSESRTFSYLYDEVSGSIAGATILENVDGDGSVDAGAINLTGVLSSGTFSSANVTLPAVSANVDSASSTVSAGRTTLGVDMTISASPTDCGKVPSSATASVSDPSPLSTPTTADDEYCVDATASGNKVARPTTTPTTTSSLVLSKGSTDSPATSAVSAEMEESGTLCDGQADSRPCAKASEEPMGLGAGTGDRFATAILSLWSQNNTVNRGTCDMVRVFDPTAGSSNSSAMVDRDLDVDAGTNNVKVTVTRQLPTIAVGCFPTRPDVGTVGAAGIASSGTANVGNSTAPYLLGTVTNLGTVSSDNGVASLTASITAAQTNVPVNCTAAIANNAPLAIAGTTAASSEYVARTTPNPSPACPVASTTVYVTPRGVAPTTPRTHASGERVFHRTSGTIVVSVPVGTLPAGTNLQTREIQIGSEKMTITSCAPACTSTTGSATPFTMTVNRGTSGTTIYRHMSPDAVTLVNPIVPNTLTVNISTAGMTTGTQITMGGETMTVTACLPAGCGVGASTFTVTRTSPIAHASAQTVTRVTAAPTSVVLNVTSSAAPGSVLTIDSEQMTVTSCGGCTTGSMTYSVTRAANGTSAASHSSGAVVTANFTPTTYLVNGASTTWNRTAFDTPPAVTGWTGGGFVVRLRDVVETITVEAGTGASAPTYSRTGYLDYWDGTAYQTATLGTSATTYSIPALMWATAGTTSMCLGAEASPTALGSAVSTSAYGASVPAGSAPTPATSNPILSASASVTSLLPPSMYFHMANTTTCTANGANEAVAHINVLPNTGSVTGTATYEQQIIS